MTATPMYILIFKVVSSIVSGFSIKNTRIAVSTAFLVRNLPDNTVPSSA